MILINGIKTPDGTRLFSEHTHDYKTHFDEVTNKMYGVDGGHEYIRYIGDVIADCTILTLEVTEETKFTKKMWNKIRNNFKWGTYGKDGTSKYKLKKLKDMSNAHIKAILETQKHITKVTRTIFEVELHNREKENILIED